MYTTRKQLVKALKEHKCTWCSEPIVKNETYAKWKSADGSWFTSKMHQECCDAFHEDCADSWDFTYTPFDNERPPCVHETK